MCNSPDIELLKLHCERRKSLMEGIKTGRPVLEFRNVSVNLKGNEVLKNASGIAEAGRLLAVMGPSGAGKTVLLTALAGRHQRGSQGGEVLLRGKTMDHTVRRRVSFVLQDDILFDQLTLKDTLMYMAQLRLPGDMPIKEKAERVANIIQALGLQKCVNTKIGNYLHRGLSGGERKRTNIGCELLTDPEVLLLDEPTSGLDSHAASELVGILRTYARRYDKVVVVAVHQPSTRTFRHFDDLLLLSEGEVVYFGKAREVLDYFSELGLHCSKHYNPGDFVIDKIKGTAEERRLLHETARHRYQELPPSDVCKLQTISSGVIEMQDEDSTAQINLAFSSDGTDSDQTTYRPATPALPGVGSHERPSTSHQGAADDPSGSAVMGSRSSAVQGDSSGAQQSGSTVRRMSRRFSFIGELNGQRPRDFKRMSSTFTSLRDIGHFFEDDDRPKWPTGFLHQLWTLSRRNFAQYRYATLSRLQAVRTLLVGCFVGAFYFQIPHEEERVHDMTGMIFFILSFWSFEAIFAAIAIFPQERTIIHKERSSGAYRLSSYFFSKILSELPLGVALPLASTTIAYWMTGLNNSPTAFLSFVATILLNNQVAHAIGLFIGAFSTSFKNAVASGSLYGLSSLLLGGFYNSAIPAYVSWLRFATVMSYSYGASIYVVFRHHPHPIRCSATNTSIFEECLPDHVSQSLYINGASILEKEASIALPLWGYYSALCGIMLTFYLLAYLVLRYIRKPS